MVAVMLMDKDRGRNTDAAASVARGVSRLLRNMGETCLGEFTLRTGRRVDIIALDRHGAFTVVEVKTSAADFRADNKWREYLDFCDRFYFAAPMTFPVEILPEDCGLMIADGYGSEIVREAAAGGMKAARRRALTLRFARAASARLMRVNDPRLDA